MYIAIVIAKKEERNNIKINKKVFYKKVLTISIFYGMIKDGFENGGTSVLFGRTFARQKRQNSEVIV